MINGSRVTDKTRTICKHCMKIMPHTAANTSMMQRHIQHHHSSVLKPTTAPVKKTLTNQTTLKNAFRPHLPQSSARATTITRDIYFHRSRYEAFFCGRKSRILATPPHTGSTPSHHTRILPAQGSRTSMEIPRSRLYYSSRKTQKASP